MGELIEFPGKDRTTEATSVNSFSQTLERKRSSWRPRGGRYIPRESRELAAWLLCEDEAQLPIRVVCRLAQVREREIPEIIRWYLSEVRRKYEARLSLALNTRKGAVA